MDRSGGTCAAALRCRTAATALLAAVSRAKMTQSSCVDGYVDVHLVHGSRRG